MTQSLEHRVASVCLLAGVVFFIAWEWFGLPPSRWFIGSSALIGLGTTLFLLTLLVLLVGVARQRGCMVTRSSWWLIAPTLLLAFDLVWYANTVVLVFAPLGAIVLILSLGAQLSLGGAPVDGSYIQPRIIRDVLHSIGGIARLHVSLLHHEQQRWRGIIRDVIVGAMIALPFLVFFSVLFSNANAAFAEFFRSLLSDEAWSAVSYRIPGIVIALGFSGYLTALFLAPRVSGGGGSGVRSELSPRVAASFFVLLDALFVTFVVFQGIEFFGGDAWLHAHGFTYASHARRGFFELIAAAGSASLLVLVWYRTLRRGEGGWVMQFATGAILTFLALTLVVAISSLQRLWTYGSVYGLTLQRAYATAIVVTIMAGLGVLANHCIRGVPFVRVARHISMLIIIMFTIAMTIPVERIVASWNASARNIESTGVPFDAEYVASMSPDAWPALFSLATQDVEVASVVQQLACPMADARFRDTHDEIRAFRWWRSSRWQSYHLANRVCDQLLVVQAEILTWRLQQQ